MIFGSGKPFLRLPPHFLWDACPKTIYLSGSKYLRSLCGSLIPYSKPHFRPWWPMFTPIWHLQKKKCRGVSQGRLAIQVLSNNPTSSISTILLVYLYDAYIYMTRIFTWRVYLPDAYIYMTRIFTWRVYLHDAYIYMTRIFTWRVYLHDSYVFF
jgi:hypothetical protein